MNDASAIKLCLKFRDPAGFDFLVRKYRREAFGHALALLGNSEDAAEACQESFASAFASMPKLEELTDFYPWFYRILRNRCLNLLGRRKTAREYASAEEGRLREASAPDNSAEQAASSAEDRAAVWRTLGKLTTEHREILALKYLKGYDYNTLAAVLRVPRGTVMSRLYHARKAFRAAYEGDDEHGKL